MTTQRPKRSFFRRDDDNSANRGPESGSNNSSNNRDERPARSSSRPANHSSGRPAPRGERSDRPARGSYGEKPAYDRSNRSERPTYDRAARGERPAYDRGERSARPANDSRGERPTYNREDRPTRGERPTYNREDRAARGERPTYNREDRSDRPARGAYGEKPAYKKREDRPTYDRAERGERSARPANDSRGERPTYNREDRATRGERSTYNREERPNRSERPSYNREDRPTSTYTKREDRPSRGSSEKVPYGQRPERVARPRVEKKEERPTYAHLEEAVSQAAKGPMRLNRFIAMSGICSRREADELIEAGQVTVNGEVINILGAKVMPEDVIELDGKVLKGERKVYIVMNKPKGYVTTTDDPHAERTVLDLLKGLVKERVYPVGRLDKNTTGVLLLTNDGDLTKELTHPSYEKSKLYHVFLDKPCTEEHLEMLAAGIELEDGLIHADEVSFVEGTRDEVGVEIHSGRNRIVRRMFEHLGYEVTRLDRVHFAGMGKMGLRRGFWRYLSPREVATLKGKNYK